MAIFKFRQKKGRRYPVRLDAQGRSARQRCFEMFEQELPAPEIAKAVGVKIDTVNKYHQQWSKNPKIDRQIAFARELLKKDSPDRARTIELIAGIVGIGKDEVEDILHQPHGLLRLMTGRFYFPAHKEAARRRYIAFELACLISDHLIKNGGAYEDVYYAFDRWMKQNQTRREEEEADIKKEDERTHFMRQILQADIERERQGKMPPEKLTREEQDMLLKWRARKAIKETQVVYWLRIGELISGGMTEEQARRKVYQDLVEKGDTRGAMMMREFQDFYHPLKTDGRPPSPSPQRPPNAGIE